MIPPLSPGEATAVVSRSVLQHKGDMELLDREEGISAIRNNKNEKSEDVYMYQIVCDLSMTTQVVCNEG